MTTLAPHQQRVVDEKNELSDRLSKLLGFFQTPIFAGLDAAERTRLRNQARFMDGYAAVLEERIAAFGSSDLDAVVSRFLSWPLPKDFGPDCGISFDGREKKADGYDPSWPTGTNLFHAGQVRDMLQHVLGG